MLFIVTRSQRQVNDFRGNTLGMRRQQKQRENENIIITSVWATIYGSCCTIIDHARKIEKILNPTRDL